MLQLVYISTAREAVASATLDAILDASRRNNARDGITGLLVAGGRRFLQALEGPDRAVLDAYARIVSDSRHHALVLLGTQVTEERAFGAWSMACERGGAAPAGGDLRAAVAALTGAISDRNLRAQFTGFVAVHARAA